MNCSLIDEQRINQGLLCRSMTCLKCNEFRQMNNEHKSKESCLSEMSSRITNLQKKLEAVTAEKNRFEKLLKEFVFFEDNNAEWKSLSEKLEASENKNKEWLKLDTVRKSILCALDKKLKIAVEVLELRASTGCRLAEIALEKIKELD